MLGGLGLCASDVEAKHPVLQEKELRCKRLFAQKHYVKSAECFRGLDEQVEQHTPKERVGFFRDRYLRFAAISYAKAAKKTKSTEHRGFWLSRASALLKITFQKGYCEATSRCHLHRSLADTFEKQIQYAELVVSTKETRAGIEVNGFQYSHFERHQFQATLRPGTYRVTVSLPSGKKHKHVIRLGPKKRMVLKVDQVKVKILEQRIIVEKKIPPLVMVSYVAGGIAFVSSLLMLAHSLSTQTYLNAQLQDVTRNKQLTDKQYDEQFTTAERVRDVGFVVGGAAFVLGSVGFIVYMATPQKKQRVMQPVRVKSEVILFRGMD